MSTSTRYPNNTSSPLSLHQTSPEPQPSTPDPKRRRPGRNARPSQLTPCMHRAVRRFARFVGAPDTVEPGGFRDFCGWLTRLGFTESFTAWDQLIATVARDVNCDIQAINELKEDVVREIVKCVVIPRPEETLKVVSTNAWRQVSRPRGGTTLMLVLEEQLERVMHRLPQLVEEVPPPSSGSDEGVDSSVENRSTTSPARQTSNLGQMCDDRLSSTSDIWDERRASTTRPTLPSFKELDDSLRRNGWFG